MAFVDLHLHLLPGVDDGPPTMSESLDHAACMAAEGVRRAVVTPHVGHPEFPVDIGGLAARTAALRAAVRHARIPLRLDVGGEIHPSVGSTLSAGELDAIAQGPPGARWVLAEVPFAGIDDGFLAGCRSIRRRGFGIVVAHPERAAGFLDAGLPLLRPEIAAGSVLLLNVGSLLGRHGAEARAAGEFLIREGLAYALASDGHPPVRTHTLRAGVEAAIEAGASRVQAQRLTQANPAFLVRHGIPRAGPAHRPWAGTLERPASAALRAARRLRRAPAASPGS